LKSNPLLKLRSFDFRRSGINYYFLDLIALARKRPVWTWRLVDELPEFSWNMEKAVLVIMKSLTIDSLESSHHSVTSVISASAAISSKLS